MEHAYTGPQYTDAECEAAIARRRLRAERLDDDELFPHVAERIADGDVVGWFQGRMEFGPRALGNRSIVVDPRRHDMKDILNARIKHREPFRPVRAVDPRRGDRRLVRAGLHVAVHGARLQDARREARARSRRSTTSTTPAASRRSSERVTPRYYRADQGVRRAHRRADRAQHVVQRERADRDDARARRRDVREDEDGPARAREPRRPAWLTSRSASLARTSARRRRAPSRRCSRAAS